MQRREQNGNWHFHRIVYCKKEYRDFESESQKAQKKFPRAGCCQDRTQVMILEHCILVLLKNQ